MKYSEFVLSFELPYGPSVAACGRRFFKRNSSKKKLKFMTFCGPCVCYILMRLIQKNGEDSKKLVKTEQEKRKRAKKKIKIKIKNGGGERRRRRASISFLLPPYCLSSFSFSFSYSFSFIFVSIVNFTLSVFFFCLLLFHFLVFVFVSFPSSFEPSVSVIGKIPLGLPRRVTRLEPG